MGLPHRVCHRATYYVLEGLADGLTGVAPFHDHGVLHVLGQLRRPALQEALGALGLGLSGDTNQQKVTHCQRHGEVCSLTGLSVRT